MVRDRGKSSWRRWLNVVEMLGTINVGKETFVKMYLGFLFLD